MTDAEAAEINTALALSIEAQAIIQVVCAIPFAGPVENDALSGAQSLMHAAELILKKLTD
jgi:hypothetical protein